MKLTKDISINPEMGFYPPIIDKKTGKILIGRWIGSVEVVIDGYHDEDGWEYVTDYFLAFQTISGKIVYVDGPVDGICPMIVYSLKGTLHDIKWGFYPDDFPKEWRYCIAAPIGNPPGIEPVETEELPF